MMHRESNPPLSLPPGLRQRFQALEQRLWWVDTTIALCGALAGLVVSYALLFLSDRLWDTPVWLRGLCTLLGAGVLACFAAGWWRQWVWQRRDVRELADVVQRHYRRLGDRLLGIVELADETKRPPNVSASLCQAAIEQVSAEAMPFDFRAAVATRKPKIYFVSAMLLFGLALAPWLFAPQAGWNSLLRWLWPGSHVPRYTFVSLESLPERLVVPHGEAFDIVCSLSPQSVWQPATATCQFERQPTITASVQKRHVVFRVPGQTQAGRLKLRVGDVSRAVGIVPTIRPALKQLTARIELPAYLQHPPVQEEIHGGAFAFLENSLVTFRGQASRTLTEASLTLGRAEAVRVKGDEFVSGPLNLDGHARCAFTWQDNLGLAGLAPHVLVLQSQKDQPPETGFVGMPPAIAVLEEEVIELRIGAQDDFGVKELGIAWDWRKRSGEGQSASREELKVQDGAPTEKTVGALHWFSPELWHIPAGSLIQMHARATDYFPGRKPTESGALRILILSREEHARMVQEQFDRLLADLEDLTRRQESLGEENRRLQQLAPEKLAADETGKQLGEQAADQAGNAEKLERLAQRSAEILRDALRNPDLPTDLLQEWTKNLETMHHLAQQDMPRASQGLKAAQQKQSAAPRSNELAKTSAVQDKILQEMQEMQKKMGRESDRLLAFTLAQRLREVAGTEAETKGTLQKILPETIGLRPEELPRPHRETTGKLASGQDRTQKEANALQDEIARFFHRTQMKNYGEVALEMNDAQTVEELARLSELIRQNLSAQAIDRADFWAQRFIAWAEKLENKKKPSKDDASGKPGEENEELLQKLLALLRLRQAEENLREQTRLLDEHKSAKLYREDAHKLSGQQRGLKEQLAELQQDSKFARAAKLLPHIHEAMGEAEGLLDKPQTDTKTVAVETDIMNLLDAQIMALIQFDEGQSAAQSAALAQLAQMLQQMGFTPGSGSRPGGNPRTAMSNQTSQPATGDNKGKSSDPRAVEKAGGRVNRTFPAEYREALQRYYQALESATPNP